MMGNQVIWGSMNVPWLLVWYIPQWYGDRDALIPYCLFVPAGSSALSSTEQESLTLVRPLTVTFSFPFSLCPAL